MSGPLNIPTFACKPGCHDCCGIVPWRKDEWQRVAVLAASKGVSAMDFMPGTVLPLRAGQALDTCPFASSAGCEVYDSRPLMCRLFGAGEARMLTCPHGCGPDSKLTDQQCAEMVRAYAEVSPC